MSTKPHTLEEFDLELQSLRGAVLAMGNVAMTMVDQFEHFLQTTSLPDASAAKEQERDLDQSEAQIDEQARTILLRFQPVATDLREVTSAVRMATDWEQIGDDARRLLDQADHILPWVAGDAEAVLQTLSQRSRTSLQAAFKAFSDQDAELASQVAKTKGAIRKAGKECREKVSRAYTKQCCHGISTPGSIVPVVDAVSSLESIGLHACSIAEAVFFIATATNIRHGHLN